jgi:signal transduction histidine kinase
MRNHHDDPELVRLMRSAAWLWLGYLVALMLIDWLLYRSVRPMFVFYLVNGLAALVFLGLAYWNGIRKILKGIYPPLMLTIIAGLPLVVNNMMVNGLVGGRFSPEGMALRQLPVLFFALVITAWQYRLVGVIIFSACTMVVDLLMVSLIGPLVTFVFRLPPGPGDGFAIISFRSMDIFVVLALVRTLSFAVVGAFMSQLMNRLRLQQKSLTDANTRLTHYASTLESLTVSRERNRMAHELHDTLAHSLTALSVQLETVKAYWTIDRKKSRQLLDQSLASTRSGLEETRRVLKSLRASPLEEMGLLLALRELAQSTAKRANLGLDLNLPENLPFLAPDVEQCIYRIAQEAIENAINHANARSLAVSLSGANGTVKLVVQDDGEGFDPTQAEQAGHLGLLGMRERATMAGGEFTLESKKGSGTIATLVIGGTE